MSVLDPAQSYDKVPHAGEFGQTHLLRNLISSPWCSAATVAGRARNEHCIKV